MLLQLLRQRHFLLLCALFFSQASFSQINEIWAKHYKPVGNRDYYPSKIVVDGSGNSYVSGAERRDTVINGIPTTISHTLVAKYDTHGNLLWDKKILEHTVPMDLKLDPQGNVVLGSFGVNSNYDYDIFIYKYSSDGNLIWTTIWDGPEHGRDYAGPMDIDAAGNIYMAGQTQDTVNILSRDVALLKLNPQGTIQWVKYWNGYYYNGDDVTRAISVRDGHVYVGGYADGVEGYADAMILKFKTDGTLVWGKMINGPDDSYDDVRALTVDAGGNVYTTGGSVGTQTQEDFFTLKLNSSGSLVWSKRYHLSGIDTGTEIALDSENNIIVSGTSQQYGRDNMFTIKYDQTATPIWTRRFNSEDSCYSVLRDMKVVGKDIYVTGNTKTDNCTRLYYVTQKYTDIGTTSWSKLYNAGGLHAQPSAMAIDNKGRVYVTGSTTTISTEPTTRGASSITTVKYGKCLIIPPSNITVNNTQGQCGAIVNYPAATVAGECGSLTYSQASGTFFPVGVTTVTVSSPSSGEQASFTITVKDVEAPTITCPAAVTVSCAADVPAVNIAAVVAQDNCSGVTVTHVDDVISNKTCTNRFTLTRTYKATDASGNSATCTQTITVNDVTPPQITGLSLSQYALWPANHTLRDITVNYTVTDNCVSQPSVTISISSNEPVNGTGDGDTDPDWYVVDDHHIKLRAERSGAGNGRIYTVTVTVNDGCNPPISESKQVFVAHNITGPKTGMPFKVGSTVSFNGTFWDKPGNVHTSKWLVDGSSVANGIVTEPTLTQTGKVSGSYKFNSPGVYKLQMNVTDATGNTSYTNTNNELDAIVVIYDPNGGYAYGGGWFQSAAGALTGNSSATGTASFGFAVNYANPAKPKGETQFEFKAGAFEFNALNFDYLVVNGAKAQFKGTGKIIGGQSGIGFIMTVTDGAEDGSGTDKIRLKIYNRSTGFVYYDNQPGASDAAAPVMEIGANSEIFIKSNSAVTMSSNEQSTIEKPAIVLNQPLSIQVSPNPSKGAFKINIKGDLQSESMLELVDVSGRVIERRKIPAHVQQITIGENLRVGLYLVKIRKGNEQVEAKLIRQ